MSILCGLCSHSSSGAAEMLQRFLRGLRGPPPGATWTWTMPLVMLPNVSIDEQKHVGCRSQKRILPNTHAAKTQSGLDSRRALWVLLAGERFMSWKWCGRGGVSMNYWRISDDDDGQTLYLLLLLLAVDRRSRCSRPADVPETDCDENKAVTSSS